jgi:hypothetical protein
MVYAFVHHPNADVDGGANHRVKPGGDGPPAMTGGAGRALRHRAHRRDRLVQALQRARLVAIAQHDKRLGKL